jgi:hypothetical protein
MARVFQLLPSLAHAQGWRGGEVSAVPTQTEEG